MGTGVKVLLEGDSGTGKTTALRTFCEALPDAGFVVATEPGVLEIIGDKVCTAGGKMHFHYIPAANPSLGALEDSAKKINSLTYEGLTKLSGIGKTEYAQFVDLLRTLQNFKCDKCGKEFGAVDTWDDTRGLALDSLSGLSLMSMDLTVGGKPVKHQGEWGVAMDNLERLVNKLCFGTRCHFAMTAHLEREFDEVTGSVTLMVSTLGKKLAPKLPRYFDDVIYCYREAAGWYWSLTKTNVSTKSRHLDYADKMKPDFTPIFEAYRKMNQQEEKPGT